MNYISKKICNRNKENINRSQELNYHQIWKKKDVKNNISMLQHKFNIIENHY